MSAVDDAPAGDRRIGAILAMVFTPWRIARPPRRLWPFALLGLLWIPALAVGGILGGVLHDRVALPAPQAALMGTVAIGLRSTPLPAWQIAIGPAAWLAGGVACGALLIGLDGLILGGLLRDRALGRRLGAAASLSAPIFALAIGVARATDVLRVHGRRDWLATSLAGALVLWLMAGRGALAAVASRDAARPALSPAGCAAAFAVASVAVLSVACAAALWPLALVRSLAP